MYVEGAIEMPKRGTTSEQISAAGAHDDVTILLPHYATITALGGAPERAYPQIAAHLASCAACRAELDELLKLTLATYTDQVALAPAYPQADLAFLERHAPRPELGHRIWFFDRAGRVVVAFSEALLASLRQPSLAGMLRSGPLYRYIHEPGSLPDLNLTIEIYADEMSPDRGRVQVVLDVPSRNTFDQAGGHVTLRAGEQSWQDQTDETGYAEFPSIPLAALPQLSVTIERHED
jgi:hypothetical protein